MRVTLVQPPYSSDPLADREPPLGLLSIGSTLVGRGDEVQIIDLQRSLTLGLLPLSDDFFAHACQRILESDPDVVGFTAMSVSYPAAVILAQEIKARRPAVKVVFGGPQATLCAQETLAAFESVDVIVRGEGEITVGQLMDAYQGRRSLQTVLGLCYREGVSVRSTPDRPLITDLDTLPFVQYELLGDLRYYMSEDDGLPSLPLDAGRGCPWGCSFCSTSLVWRRKFRLKSVSRLLSEMRTLHGRHGIRFFSLQHDMLTTARQFVVRFCQALIEAGKPFHWGCSSRVDTVDPELLDLMSRAGCSAIFFGVETASPELQVAVNKRLDVDRVLPVIKWCAERKIAATASFIIGFPQESKEQLNASLEMALACKALGASNVQIHVLIPETGTALLRQAEGQLVLREDYLRARQMLITHDGSRELQLIRRNPDIFAGFYNIQPKYLSTSLLYEVASNLRLLVYLYPQTIWLFTRATGSRPLAVLGRIRRFLCTEGGELLVTDLRKLQAGFSAFLGVTLAEVNAGHRDLIMGVFEFEDAGAAFRARLERDPEYPRFSCSERGYFLLAGVRLLKTKFSVTNLLNGVSQGDSFDTLAENQAPGWVLYMAWGRRLRIFTGLSELKAALLSRLREGPLDETGLKEAAHAQWPGIRRDELDEQVERALQQLLAAGIIADQERLLGPTTIPLP